MVDAHRIDNLIEIEDRFALIQMRDVGEHLSLSDLSEKYFLLTSPRDILAR